MKSDTDETYEEGEDKDDLDLESVIAELEAELDAQDDAPTDEMYEEEDEMKSDEDEMKSEEEDMENDGDDSEDEEEIDLDEVIKTLKEMEDDSEKADDDDTIKEEEEDSKKDDELEEAYLTIESLQKTINEVNLLNAKLLYTNKLFRTFELNENQKVKVLENFDRTSSVREVKLVFSTLAENLNVAKKKRTVVKEGYASKATKSSAPKKIISEGNDMAARWKKLAGLK
jgi:cobalamin biosynthesis protein CobT